MSKNILIATCLLLATGCMSVPPHSPAHEYPAKLVQLNDKQWVDLGDVREILFLRNDATAIASGVEPFAIALWHRGTTDNPFKFTFTDEKLAYASWKRLTQNLGGNLHEDAWTANSAPAPTPTSQPAAASNTSGQSLFNNRSGVSNSFVFFRDDMNALATCRDEKLITPAEYQRGHDHKVADFIESAGNGTGYTPYFKDLHTALTQLEALKKDQLLSESDLELMHKKIVSRYIPSSD